jgi:polar amino acid transport system substrate-binding protein
MSDFLRRILALGIVSTTLIIAGCGETSKPDAEKVYLVGTDASYAPFESVNDKNEIVGFDIDVLKAVAEKAGIKVQFINTPWEGIFNTLSTGDRDIVASATTITDERRKTLDFSDPYFEAQQLIGVLPNSTITHFAQLKNKKVGVQTATTGDVVVQTLLGKTNANIKRFEGMPLALQELLSGGVDAVVGDNGVMSNFVQNNPNKPIKVFADAAFEKEFYGFGVRKGNTDLLAKLNAGLKTIKDNGTYQKIHNHYFAKP